MGLSNGFGPNAAGSQTVVGGFSFFADPDVSSTGGHCCCCLGGGKGGTRGRAGFFSVGSGADLG